MSQKTEIEEKDPTRQVGLIANYHVEFGCFVERRRGGKRRVRYDVRINGWPSSASFYVEGDQRDPALSEAQVEAACAYIQKFLRDGMTDGLELVLVEAHQLTHASGDRTFLRKFCDDVKQSSRERLTSNVAKRKRQSWLKFEATAKVHRDTAFFKEYRADYKQLYQDFATKTHRRSDNEFLKKVWREHERTAFPGHSPEYLDLALRVAQASRGDLTPKEAAIEWVSKELLISPATIERHYVYRRKKKPAKTS